MKNYRIGEPVLVDGQPASVVSDFGDKVRVRFVRENGLLDSLNVHLVTRDRVSPRS